VPCISASTRVGSLLTLLLFLAGAMPEHRGVHVRRVKKLPAKNRGMDGGGLWLFLSESNLLYIPHVIVDTGTP
jgi:hypothetical protein